MSTAELQTATVLWFRPSFGRGAVKLDTGRHFLFSQDQLEELDEVVSRQRVRFRANPVAILPLEDGRIELAPEAPVASSSRSAPSKSRSRKSSEPGIAVGTRIKHKRYGEGVVMRATAHMAHIRFGDSEDLKVARISGLTIL